MLPFRRILFPVDYSEPCQAVVSHVKAMLNHCGDGQAHPPAGLVLVHAFAAEALAYSELPISDPDLPAAAEGIQEERLREFATKMFPGRHVECVTECGEPGTVIQEALRKQAADLVMMPTHGRGPVRRFLLGSVTTKVLHDTSAAVWTGTGSAIASHKPALPYKSILCALDGSPEAECVLKAAQAVAGIYDASLSLVRMVEPAPVGEFDMTPYQQDRIEAAKFDLRELQGKLGLDLPHDVIEAPVAEGVRREALRRKADLVITGRGHAQGIFTSLRSHLYQLVRESPCPVLSI